MKLIRLMIWTSALVFSSSLFLPSSAGPQPKIPPDLQFPQGKDSPGVVTFSHEWHTAPERVNKCTECHIKIFKLKKGASGTITMEKIKNREQCGVCHNGEREIQGKVVFLATDEANCGRCHKKQ